MDKKNKGLIIVIVILLLGLLCSIGYICYDKGVFGGNKENSNNKIETKTEDKNSKSERIALDDSRFYGIYKKLKPYTYEKNRSDAYQSFTDSELFNIVATELKETDFVKTSENITDIQGEHTIYTLSNDAVINYLKKYFGNNVKLEGYSLVNPNIAYETNLSIDNFSGMSVVAYDNSKYKIKWIDTSRSGIIKPKITERKIVSATMENNEIIVKEKAIYIEYPNLYGEVSSVIYAIYSDVNKTNKIDSKEYTIDNFTDGVITVEDYLDKSSTITTKFAYDKDTNSYYFKSSTIK